ncbi:MAG: UDP-N-acetylglucosamine 1-carboxyvinyltransferase, partial [Clostridium sp.]
MSMIEVHGLRPLKGEINVQGSKNAVLPMMAAAVLNHGTTIIHNVP